jgi:hypothetical protein
MACTKFNKPVSSIAADKCAVIRIPNDANTTALGYRIFLRKILKDAWRDNKDIYVVFEKVEKLENLIDTDPYIFDDDVSPEDRETKIEFFTVEEFKEFLKNHKIY